ncbi:MAG: hypothetical protein ABSE51_01025 [Terracidiphilus sp.]|jgi:hypothetical protein
MKFVPMMWAVWGTITLIAAVLYLYRSSLTRDEEDQIYLDDAFQHEKVAQEAILARVSKVEPIVRLSKWFVAAATVFVVGYYVLDIVNQFK